MRSAGGREHLELVLRQGSFTALNTIRPGDRQQKGTVNDAIDVMGNVMFQCQHLAGSKVHRPLGCPEPDSSVEGVYGDASFRSVLLQTTALLNRHQDDAQIGILCKRLCRVAGLPPALRSQLFDFVVEIKRQE